MNKNRFTALWTRCAEGASDGAELFDDILRHYEEPHRNYHRPEHIDHCLQQFDQASRYMDDVDAVELALWFHDVIYHAGADDNEQRSADYFSQQAKGAMAGALRQKVMDLIMATTHKDLPETRDECFVVDIDLSSFGLPWEAFCRDSEAVRSEFAHISDAEFYPNHQAFMQHLLKREYFCFTEFFRDRHEAQAQQNIARLLEEQHRQGLVT